MRARDAEAERSASEFVGGIPTTDKIVTSLWEQGSFDAEAALKSSASASLVQA